MTFSLALGGTYLSQLARVFQRTTKPTALTNLRKPVLRRERAAFLQDLALTAELAGPGFECVARTEPHLDFNGDYYGFQEDEEQRVAFFLGDVAGKGLPAAFYQTSCLTLLRQCSRFGSDPVEVLNEVNSVLAERGENDRYSTLLYGVFDAQARTVSLASAGHPCPILLGQDGTTRILELPASLPVGLSSNAHYHCATFKMEVGDSLILYSNGTVDTKDRSRIRTLGRSGLRDLLEKLAGCSSTERLDRLMSEILDFGGRRGDDQTFLSVTSLEDQRVD